VSAAPMGPSGEPERPGYRFPAVAAEVVQFQVRLPAFPGAPEGFTGSLEGLLERLRDGSAALRALPLAPLVEQYLGFLAGLPRDTTEEASEFVPLAATLIQLKSQLLAPARRQPPEEQVRAEIVAEIARRERERRAEAAPAATLPAACGDAEELPGRLTLLDLWVLLQEVRTPSRSGLSIPQEDFTVDQALAWLRASLPRDAAIRADEYFERRPGTRDRVVVFLAILELVRIRCLDCHQPEAFGPLWLWRTEPAASSEMEHGSS
jgi:segregation and condensation protein A